MPELLQQIDKNKLPSHIAIIMDGNGRWAKEQGKDRLFGHYHGVESVRNIVEGSAELGIKYLTLYAFSTENWDRPEYEVIGLMELLVTTIRNEVLALQQRLQEALAEPGRLAAEQNEEQVRPQPVQSGDEQGETADPREAAISVRFPGAQ